MNSSTVQATFPHFVAFDAAHRSAATAVLAFASLSTLVLSIVLLGIVCVQSYAAFKRTAPSSLAREVFLFRSQLGQYAFSLILSKWFSAVGGLINVKWLKEDGVAIGPFCSAQGVLYEMGNFASSFFIVTMGIHTFNTLVLRNRQPQWLGPVVTALGWGATLAISIGPLLSISDRASGPLYNIRNLSCGYSKSAPVAHMLLYFVPMFLASLLSVIVYSLIFLILRGTITINGGLRFQLDPERRFRLRNQTFEEYQRFVYSVARTMLWLPITFVFALYVSAILQLRDMSGSALSPGTLAFSYILIFLDGIFDVLILFNVLRALGVVVKSQNRDLEKGRSERGSVSRPTYDWKPQSTFAPPFQGKATRTAPPAHPPSTMLQGSASRPFSLGRSLFQPHKKTGSSDSSTRLLTRSPPSRSNSPSPSLKGSEISVTTIPVQQPIVPTSVFGAFPHMARRKPTETGSQLQLPTGAGLTPYPPSKHPRTPRGLSPIPGTPVNPPSSAPFLEVTLHSPASANSSPTTDDFASFISMYFSHKSTELSDLPVFPDPAVPRHGSIVSLHNNVPPARPVLVHPPTVVPQGAISRPKAALSISAVGAGYGHTGSPSAIPDSPPARVISPADSTDASRYSGTISEAGTLSITPREPQPRPISVFQPTQPLRPDKAPTVNAWISNASERRLLDAPRWSRTSSMNRAMPRALPIPPNRPSGWRSPSIYSQATSTVQTPSRQGSSSSTLNRYR